VKLDVDTLATVPADPPAAGPDRALEPPPPAAPRPNPGRPDVAEGDAAVVEGEVAQPAEAPITAHVSAAATILERPAAEGSGVALIVSLGEDMETTSVRWEYGRASRVAIKLPQEKD
jgi:hypothetical protein